MKDRCVICQKETKYDNHTHVDARFNYIEGMGQLCSKCFIESNTIPRNAVCVPEKIIENTPNDSELGELIRNIYRNNLY